MLGKRPAPVIALALAALVVVLALTGCAGISPATTAANTVALNASLTGAAEGATAGDPDGSGSANIVLNDTAQTVCYTLTVSNIEPATAAHIHRGAAGQAGPVVVPLGTPSGGSVQGCSQNIDANTIRAIAEDPGGYYVNVHNTTYPDGAIRGQLSR